MPIKEIIQIGQPAMHTERRMYSPTDYTRAAALAAIPFGEKGTAVWFTDGNRKILRYGLPKNINDPKLCVLQNFTIDNDRDAMYRVTMRDQLDSYEVVSDWEPLPEGAKFETSCITLVTRAIPKAGVRPTPAGKVKDTDYEDMNPAQLKTQIGLLGVKGADGKPLNTRGLSAGEMVACIRDHLAKNLKPVEIPNSTADKK